MSEVKIKVKVGRRPFFWLTANNPTSLGLILQSKSPKEKMEIVEGLEYTQTVSMAQFEFTGTNYFYNVLCS